MAIDPEVRTYLFYGAMVLAVFVLLIVLSKRGENLLMAAKQAVNPGSTVVRPIPPLDRPGDNNTRGGLSGNWKPPGVGNPKMGTYPTFKSNPIAGGAGGVKYGGMVAPPNTDAGTGAAYKGRTAANGGPTLNPPNTTKKHQQYMKNLNKQLADANATLEKTDVTWWTRDYGVRQLNNGAHSAYLDPTKPGGGTGEAGGAAKGAGGGNAYVQRLASKAGVPKNASVSVIQAFANAYSPMIMAERQQ